MIIVQKTRDVLYLPDDSRYGIPHRCKAGTPVLVVVS